MMVKDLDGILEVLGEIRKDRRMLIVAPGSSQEVKDRLVAEAPYEAALIDVVENAIVSPGKGILLPSERTMNEAMTLKKWQEYD
jgi:hypothetical protein